MATLPNPRPEPLDTRQVREWLRMTPGSNETRIFSQRVAYAMQTTAGLRQDEALFIAAITSTGRLQVYENPDGTGFTAYLVDWFAHLFKREPRPRLPIPWSYAEAIIHRTPKVVENVHPVEVKEAKQDEDAFYYAAIRQIRQI